MANLSLTDGAQFKTVMTSKSSTKIWLYDFKGIKVKGIQVDGIRVFFPKEKRTELSKLDHSSLATMTLSETEDETMFFLRADATISDDITAMYK